MPTFTLLENIRNCDNMTTIIFPFDEKQLFSKKNHNQK